MCNKKYFKVYMLSTRDENWFPYTIGAFEIQQPTKDLTTFLTFLYVFFIRFQFIHQIDELVEVNLDTKNKNECSLWEKEKFLHTCTFL